MLLTFLVETEVMVDLVELQEQLLQVVMVVVLGEEVELC
jgi:hypothetical protein